MAFELFSERMQQLVKQKGFIEPTLPQKMGIPHILSGKNVLIIAPTGSGKTEVSCLPLFDLIQKEKRAPISMLYINPLRSLSRDLLDRLVWWADKLDLEIAVRHGDVPARERAAQAEMPPHILITTPETLGAILVGRKMREHLKNVKYVVVDEIHELVESKRGIQLSLLLERLRELAGDFQRIGLSATVGSPEKVAAFLGKDVKVVRAELEKRYNIRVENPKPGAKDKSVSDDLLIGPETTARLRRLHELIAAHRSVLAFTNTRETAEVLSSRLRSLDRELKQAVHHGSLSKEKRIRSEKEFKQQTLKSLIATSSLELGIDIGSIDLVIQYLSPRQVARLIQRVGRSGHRVGEVSKGIVLSGDEDLFESTVVANRAMQGKLEEVKIHNMALDVLAIQMIGVLFDKDAASPEQLHGLLSRSYPYAALEKKDVDEMVKFLEALRLVWLQETPDGIAVRKRRRAFEYYFENLSTIPTKRQYRVISVVEQEPIGFLDEEFVAEHGQTGEKFVVSGRAWRIIQVEKDKVIVEPVEDIESAIPAWEGELIPVPYDIAQDVGKLRKAVLRMDEKEAGNKYHTDVHAVRDMRELMERQSQFFVPDDRNILIETYKDFIVMHCCFGSLANDTIGRYLGAVLTEETGTSVNVKVDPYRIILQTTLKPEKLQAILTRGNEDVEEMLTRAIERSTLFKSRFIHVARRFGILSRQLDLERVNMGKIITQYAGTPCYRETLREIFLDKMDMARARDIFARLAKDEIKIKMMNGLSPLGELGLMHQFGDVMKPAMPKMEVFRAFRRRLLATRVRLVCVNCGDYSVAVQAKDVEQQPECPLCASRLIACVSRRLVQAPNLVKKKLRKKELTAEEMKTFLAIRRSADLVMVYGKNAVVALAGHGVGPETAARILAKLHPTKEKLLQDILEAEKQFAYTKKFWK
ncbi:MAG: DEAD/DEAH box helicase [Candidatus Aenigmarchaeota archaeon]|nr:DEAD/DEAH box helicase [Candidatus Aenigmarchaeota archaeon]